MEQMYKTRLEHVCSRLTKMGLTQMIVSDPLSIRYLTGVWVDPYERLYALYLRTDGKHRFFLNNLFVVPDIDIPKTWFSDTDDGVAVIAGLVDGNVDMGIDKNWPARFLLALMEHHPNVRYVNASSCIDGERAIKDEYERQKMREASLLNDVCIEKAAAHIKAGMTELECADYIRSLYKEAGCIESFSTLDSFGANAADPHHEPYDTVLKPCDGIVIDIGCEKEGYCSDMTRTVALGHATEEMRKVYDTVLRAQLAGIAASHAGASGKSVDGAARDIITEAGYGPYFGHSYGHSLGLEIHEAPNCTPRNENPIPAGAVCSAEPGIYIPGKFGVRIEDVVIFREGGCEVITHSPKELTIL